MHCQPLAKVSHTEPCPGMVTLPCRQLKEAKIMTWAKHTRHPQCMGGRGIRGFRTMNPEVPLYTFVAWWTPSDSWKYHLCTTHLLVWGLGHM